MEGDIAGHCNRRRRQRFQSTPSVWRETIGNHQIFVAYSISIHSLRMEGDPVPVPAIQGSWYFNPLPPYGGRHNVLRGIEDRIRFQSTPSVWRETVTEDDKPLSGAFQSTPSVWRETIHEYSPEELEQISIHSLRMEGDGTQCHMENSVAHFNPLPPYGGRPCRFRFDLCIALISIHSLRMEGDSGRRLCSCQRCNFNPLPPYGGRRQNETDVVVMILFQSTPSVWRETCRSCFF